MDEQHHKLLEEGRVEELIKIFEKELEANPNDYKSKKDLALVYGMGGRLKDSIRLYEELLSVKPDDSNALVNLGLDYHKIGENDKAIKTLERVVEQAKTKNMEPATLSSSHTNLGVIYESMLDFDRAVGEYKKAISTYSDNKTATKYLQKLKELGSPDRGIFRTRVSSEDKKVTEIWYYNDAE